MDGDAFDFFVRQLSGYQDFFLLPLLGFMEHQISNEEKNKLAPPPPKPRHNGTEGVGEVSGSHEEKNNKGVNV